MNTENTQNRYSWKVFFGEKPVHGSRALPVSLDFSQANPIEINLSYEQQQLRLEFVQSLFIDNSNNAGQLIVTMAGSGQVIKCPAGWQGFYPVLAGDNEVFNFATGGTPLAKVFFLSFPVPAASWPADGGAAGGTTGADFSANKPALAANLITTIPANAGRAYLEVQNQDADDCQVVLDDGADNNISIIICASAAAGNMQGAAYTNATFKGRLRVYSSNATAQILARED